MASYDKLQIAQYARPLGRKVEEAAFWSRYKAPVLVKEYAAVTAVAFCPVEPHLFAVSSSARVQLYSSRTHDVVKTISRFTDTAYSADFRDDGRLLVAGDAAGLIQLFDINSRAILRTLRGHDGATRVTHFFPGGKSVLSGSDDKTVKVWDIATETATTTFEAHTDHIRAALVLDANPNLVLSSSYDHSIKLWDIRTPGNEVQMQADHGDPVEDMVLFPGSRLLVSAGGNSIRVWDLVAGGRMLQATSNHQKTITSVCLDSSAARLLTGSVDQQVKIYDTSDFTVLHSLRYPGPVECVALSPDDRHVVVGTHTGLLSIRQRLAKTEEQQTPNSTTTPHRNTRAYQRRGAESIPDANEVIVEHRRRQRLRPYDKLLKAFKYGAALDAVLLGNHQSVIVVSLLQELILRGGLRAAIAGRDEDTLEPLLVFITKNVVRPRYTAVLVDVFNVTLDVYADVVVGSTVLEEAVSKVCHKISQEAAAQRRIQLVVGALDMITAQ